MDDLIGPFDLFDDPAHTLEPELGENEYMLSVCPRVARERAYQALHDAQAIAGARSLGAPQWAGPETLGEAA